MFGVEGNLVRLKVSKQKLVRLQNGTQTGVVVTFAKQ
jgi:hypothetical protein